MDSTESHSSTSQNKIWLHVILSTLNDESFITSKLEPFLYKHLLNLLKESGCTPVLINGMPEHVHLLLVTNPDKSVSEIIRHIKKESSQTINLAKLSEAEFAWQGGYAAYSVSESQVDKVSEYINTQKEYHKKVTFREEFEKFLQAHKLNASQEKGLSKTVS